MLSPIFALPSNADLRQIETDRSRRIEENRVIAMLMPETDVNADSVLWEYRGNVKGLMKARGGNEPFPMEQDTGITRFAATPVRLGEARQLDEIVIESKREIGSFASPFDVGEELGRLAMDIAIREHNTMDKLRWDLLVTGVASAGKVDGTTMPVAQIEIVTASAGTPWSTVASATPTADLMSLRETYRKSFDFGQDAVMVMNSKTADKLLLNTNASDIGRIKLNLGQSIVSIEQINGLSTGYNIPKIVVVDDGYLDDNDVFQRFIPEGKVVIVGKHWAYGLKVGEWCNTRNASLNGQPGIYAEAGVSAMPPKLPWIARGRNGGPRMNYAGQVIVFTAYTP